MTLALFDQLTGHYANGHATHTVARAEQTHYSVQSHLSRLLNARQGTLSHLPDYGLPDVPEIYRGLPYSIHALIRSMRQTIEKYEPRLQQVQIHQKGPEDDGSVLRLDISGVLAPNQHVRFDTRFSSAGAAKVTASPHQKRDV